MAIQFYLTNAGKAAVLHAESMGLSIALSHIGVGTAKYNPQTAASNTALVAELEQYPLNGGSVEPVSRTLRFISNIDPLDDLVREFIYGEPDEMESGFDAATGKKLSRGKMSTKSFNGKKIRYKAIAAIRKGIKTVVNKRLPGQKVRLSSDQKAGLKKARLKAASANSIRKRMKSLLKGKKLGLYK